MNNGLADEHAVKGVPVVWWEAGQIEGGLLFQWQRCYAMLFSLGRNEALRRLWQGQPSESVLDSDFPG